jgi:4-aminobutyrate aminotransferase-like enzyme
LTTSGSEAVEVAIKLAYAYTKKPGVISFYGAFHGQTLGALSVTSQNCFRDPFYPLIAKNVLFAEYPRILRSVFSNPQDIIKNTIKMLENIVTSGHSGAFPIGAIIIEPFQNASGYIVPPSGFLSALREFCDRNNILLISDEIFTGFGRCGKWLSFDYENIVADITCVGKVMGGGVPSAACLAPSRIMKAIDNSGLVPLHGSTFQGNPISCTAIIATIEILKSENLIDNSYKIGEKFRKELHLLFDELDIIGDIRRQGSATAIEFVTDKNSMRFNPNEASRFNSFLMSNGVATLITGVPYGNSIAFCPPFVLGDDEFNKIMDICKKYKDSF